MIVSNLLQRNKFPVIRQDHAKGCCPAFHVLHLHDDGNLYVVVMYCFLLFSHLVSPHKINDGYDRILYDLGVKEHIHFQLLLRLDR